MGDRGGENWYSSDQLLNEVENYSIVKAIGTEREPAVKDNTCLVMVLYNACLLFVQLK